MATPRRTRGWPGKRGEDGASEEQVAVDRTVMAGPKGLIIGRPWDLIKYIYPRLLAGILGLLSAVSVMVLAVLQMAR